ncbi:MAG: hypothetical protein M3335_11980, partial [Actinomycetota bacterium]|nr:hypothetical protein [Actinomycetota bacterium]
MRTLRGWIGTCAVLALALAALAPAARAEWLPPLDISEPSHRVAQPHVALDSEGNATAVWERGNGTSTVIESAYRPAGESWGEPVAISPPAATSPQVKVDRNGFLTAIWERREGMKVIIESVGKAPGGSWGAAEEITELPAAIDPEPWLAIDWEGNTTAVWKHSETVMSAFRSFGGSWGEPIPLSAGKSYVPQAAMDGRGDATAVWMRDNGPNLVVESAYRPEQGEWGEPELVSQPGEEGGNPHVAVDGKGDSLVAWRSADEEGESVRAAYRPAGGAWSEPVDVSVEGEEVEQVRVALDPAGNAIVAWSGSDEESGYRVVRAAFKPVGGEWEAPVALSEPVGNGFPSDVVFNQSGDAALIWQRWDGTTNLIQVAYRPAGEEWEAPVDLSEEGKQAMDSVVVLDAPGSSNVADGDATAIWVSGEKVACESKKESPCFSYVVQAAGYNPDGLPEIEVEAPEEGVAGEPLEIGTPTEGLYAPQIEFGDGEEFAGAETTHVYDEPGEYLITVEGAEELGYRTSAQRAITILPAGGGEEEPKPEPEPDPEPKPDPEGGGDGGPGVATLPIDITPSLMPPLVPSPACTAAKGAREVAAARLGRIKAKLESADGAKAQRRLTTVKRKR